MFSKQKNMREAQTIYLNEFGVSFYWKDASVVFRNKIQLVFKETGLLLTSEELSEFKCLIEDSISSNTCCEDCVLKSNCNKYLLKTPFTELDLAMSIYEMEQMNNLISTTLFKIDLDNYIFGHGRN